MEFLVQAFAFGLIIAAGGIGIAKMLEWWDKRGK